MTQSALWKTEYGKMPQWQRNHEGQSIYPRYLILDAVLEDLESVEINTLEDLNFARQLFAEPGEAVRKILEEPRQTEVASASINEEWSKFGGVLRNLSEAELATTEGLFYRKKLSEPETQTLWQRLRKIWRMQEHYWYPLAGEKWGAMEAFQDKYFDAEVGVENIRRLLLSKKIERIFELREYGANYELDTSALQPWYNLAEGYWFSASMDWIIYASHENSITVAGDWLLKAVIAAWPSWQKRVWTSPFFS